MIRGVFAPYDTRDMEGEFESFEQHVERTEGRKAEVDDWNSECEVCAKGGAVLLCQGCNLVYHERCIVTKTLASGLARNQEFLCPGCVQDLNVVEE